MRITSLARRSAAVLVATALMTTGGVAGGLLTAAWATADCTPASAGSPCIASVASVTPTSATNSGTRTITLLGSGFVPASDSVNFVPSGFSGGSTIAGTLDTQNSTPSTLIVSANFTTAAPGGYDVVVVQGLETDACPYSRCRFTVNSEGPANVTGVTRNVATNSHTLKITGNTFAKGALVSLLKADDVTPDSAIVFGTVAFVSASTVTVNFTQNAGFTPGLHRLHVTNTDGKVGASVPYYMPFFTAGSVSPPSRGDGATDQVITVTGSGFDVGSTLAIDSVNRSLGSTSSCADVVGGPATVGAGGTTISAHFSFVDSCGLPLTSPQRAVTITAPQGDNYVVANAFTINPPPTVTSPSSYKAGRNQSGPYTFQGGQLSTSTTFALSGTGVTAAVQSAAADGSSATVLITVANDAALGNRSLILVNPDGGSTVSSTVVTVTAAPVVTSANPTNVGRPTTDRLVTLTGTNFATNVTVAFVDPTPGANNGISTGTVTRVSATTLRIPVSVASGASPGLRDIIVRNPDDGGTTTCVGCFGIDALSVYKTANQTSSESNSTNNGLTNLTFLGDVGSFSPTSDAFLSRYGGAASSQPDIHGTNILVNANGSLMTGNFDFRSVAPGAYNALVTTGTTTVSCVSCFSISGLQQTVTAISPTNAGQGATNLPATLTGTNFSHGEQLTITGLTVHDVTFVSPTQLTALVDIPAAVATGSRDVYVTNADGSVSTAPSAGPPATHTATQFTVNAGPKPTAPSTPISLGQGAIGKTVTVKGTDFVDGRTTSGPSSSLDLGPGVHVTAVTVTKGAANPPPGSGTLPDTLVATVTVDSDAATTARNITVTNPDAGVGSVAGFSVHEGPRTTSFSPGVLQPGATQSVTITGTGFAADTSGTTPVLPTVAIANVDVTVTAVNSPTSMTATFVVQSPCTASATPTCGLGPRAVTVTNPDGGTTTRSGAFTVATPPLAPTAVTATVTADGTGATVTWADPTSNGGSAVTGFVVDEGDIAIAEHPVAESVRSYTFSGLTAGKSYVFTVKALNAAGTGPAAAAPKFATTLTSSRSVVTGTAGSTVIYSGRLTRSSGGSPLGGALISVTLTPDIGTARVVSVRTNSSGDWSFLFAPAYNETVRTSFAATAAELASTAPIYRMLVAAKVTRSAPASGSSSSRTSVLVVSGSVYPNKAGRTVYLRRGTLIVSSAVVASNSTFALRSTLGLGTYTLNIYMPSTPGNTAGASTPFVIHRT